MLLHFIVKPCNLFSVKSGIVWKKQEHIAKIFVYSLKENYWKTEQKNIHLQLW